MENKEIRDEDSKEMYRTLFEDSAVPIWKEDFSGVKHFFNELKSSGITNFRTYFEEHPQDVKKCASMVKIINVNAESLRFFQAANKEDVIKKLPSYFCEDSWNAFKNEMIALAEGNTHFESEIPIIDIHGNRRELILKISVPRGMEDTLKMVVVSFIDITERKHIEEELRKSKEKYQGLFEANKDGIIIFTVSPENQFSNFLEVNNAAAEMIGYTREELMNLTIMEIDEKTDEETLRNRHTEIMTKGYSNFETVSRHKNGSKIDVDVVTVPIKYDDRFALMNIVRDITERKKTEKDLIKTKEKAEESERLKSSFLANMSHELRTPMVGILGFSEYLKNELADSPLKSMSEYIFDSGARLMETLNLILDLSRIEAGKLEIKNEFFNLNEEIENSINVYAISMNRKGLYLKFDKVSEVLYLDLDKRIVRSVINNLLNNAIKYTETGGITITSGDIIENDMKFAAVSIEDTGIGIPEDKIDIIFDEFRQVSEGINRAFEGIGLGLSLTKKFLEKMDGSISVKSEVGKGTVLTVKFPMRIKTESFIASQTNVDKNISLPKTVIRDKLQSILVVDNDESTNALVSIYLDKHYLIDTAKNGSTAISLANNKIYDAILMDINLGKGINGIETTKEIRKINGYENIPIIALTAFALEGDREEFISGGCSEYISKPFTRSNLLSLIKSLIP